MPPASAHFAPLRQLLDDVLGDVYAIERELGGGGMSRVFVAEERALGRRVVIKVLPPDLAAGLNAERFRREIQLAAGLQHPHIVPLLTAGVVGGARAGEGLLYFTMPFIEGESLRARLARQQAAGHAGLPLDEAVRVLHDVADALAYAHARGVVHRDVKPDNVLMSGAHAVVTDFGVAKALRSAAATPSGGGTPASNGHVPTEAGLAIGTPAYMAPEQAAADPAVDHRADIYAFGVLAFELLAGRAPFAGRAPQELLAAHLTEDAPLLTGLRAEVPPALAALVARCLAKLPADRPASADEVRDALAALATPGRGLTAAAPRPRRRGRRRALLATAAGLVAVAAAGAALWPEPPAVDEGIVAVAPFRVAGGDPALRYLREGMIDLLAATLTGDAGEGGGPRSADPRALLSAWRRAAGSDTADLPRAAALEVAERVGAGLLLLGDVTARAGGDSVVIGASIVRVRDGRAQAPARVAGPVDSLPRLVERLAAALLAAEAGEGERTTALSSVPLPALRAYLAGQSLYRRSRYRESAGEFERALALDSTFALAGVGLAGAASWFGDPAQQKRGLSVAWRGLARLSARDRALFEARAGTRFPQNPTFAELAAAKLRYAAVAPERPDAWFEAGDALFHFGDLVGEPAAHARAVAAFERALALDSSYAPALEHLVSLAARAGDTAQVRRYAALYFAIDSASENADGVRWRAAVATGDRRTVDEIVRRAGELSEISAHTIEEVSQLDGVGLDAAEAVVEAHRRGHGARHTPEERQGFALAAHDFALNRGRPTRALALTDSMLAAGAPELVVLHTRVADALFGDGDAKAAAAAAGRLAPRAFAPAPAAFPARAQQEFALCVVELWRLAHGDTSTVRRSVDRLRAPFPGELPPGALSPTRQASGCALMLEAAVAASSPTPGAAGLQVAERLDSALRTGPGGFVQMGGTLIAARLRERLGDPRGALAVVRRREYFYGRTAFLAAHLREEARLAERVGDREGAVRALRHFAALRAGAEPALRAEAAQAMAAAERLAGDA